MGFGSHLFNSRVQFVPIGQSASPACVGLSTIDSETISLDPQHPTTIYFLTCGWPQVSNGDIDYSWFGSSVSTNACPVVGSTYPAGTLSFSKQKGKVLNLV